jgi:hypothetical protein
VGIQRGGLLRVEMKMPSRKGENLEGFTGVATEKQNKMGG